MSVTWLSVTWGRSVSCVVVSRVLSLRYKQCRIRLKGNELPGQKASVVSAEMRLACSRDLRLMVLGRSLPLATKWHHVCQKM